MSTNFYKKKNSRTEKEKLINSPTLYRVNNNNDALILQKKGIVSPDLKDKEYRFFDPNLRIAYFFSNQEKYIRFLKSRGYDLKTTNYSDKVDHLNTNISKQKKW